MPHMHMHFGLEEFGFKMAMKIKSFIESTWVVISYVFFGEFYLASLRFLKSRNIVKILQKEKWQESFLMTSLIESH